MELASRPTGTFITLCGLPLLVARDAKCFVATVIPLLF